MQSSHHHFIFQHLPSSHSWTVLFFGFLFRFLRISHHFVMHFYKHFKSPLSWLNQQSFLIIKFFSLCSFRHICKLGHVCPLFFFHDAPPIFYQFFCHLFLFPLLLTRRQQVRHLQPVRYGPSRNHWNRTTINVTAKGNREKKSLLGHNCKIKRKYL